MHATVAPGVDGVVELKALLDRLASSSQIAADAPREPSVYSYLSEGEARGGEQGRDFTKLIELLVRELGIWWSPETYARMPILTPWCVRDRSCRYDQGPESWGSPMPDGHLRDDSSIIKKLPLPLLIEASAYHAYAKRKPWRGFTACHVWRDLPDGVAGEDPWLYSFVPNLVWLPSWLAPLSDRQGSATQRMLQKISVALFREAEVAPSLRARAEQSWGRLPPPPAHGPAADHLARFTPTDAFFRRRLKTINKFTEGCDEVLAGGVPKRKIVCSRYTEGLPNLDQTAISRFSNDLRTYAQAVEANLPS